MEECSLKVFEIYLWIINRPDGKAIWMEMSRLTFKIKVKRREKFDDGVFLRGTISLTSHLSIFAKPIKWKAIVRFILGND